MGQMNGLNLIFMTIMIAISIRICDTHRDFVLEDIL